MPKTTKDANQPRHVQHTWDQGQWESIREAEPARRPPNGKRMKDEKEQDRKVGHATSVKAATDDVNHKGRNSSKTTRTNHTKHKHTSIITDSITNHVTGSITIANKENQQARQSKQKPTIHQRMHATYWTSTDISGIGFIQEYEAGP
jgi:hypothetical protein